MWGPLLFGTAAAVAILLVWSFDLPPYAAWLVSVNTATFVAFGWDKARARWGGWRIPEMSLHALSVAGGFAGGWIGGSLFRHKTNRKVFLLIQVLSFGLHSGILFFLISSKGSL